LILIPRNGQSSNIFSDALYFLQRVHQEISLKAFCQQGNAEQPDGYAVRAYEAAL
jgi:hypothetical protein